MIILRQYRIINGYRLCRTLSLHIFRHLAQISLDRRHSLSALNLYNLTKNLTVQSHDNNYAVLPSALSRFLI